MENECRVWETVVTVANVPENIPQMVIKTVSLHSFYFRNPQNPQRNDTMKNIERAFSFLFHIFRAAEKMRPKEKYWHIKGYSFDKD